jgi:antirestriction protein ArdC
MLKSDSIANLNNWRSYGTSKCPRSWRLLRGFSLSNNLYEIVTLKIIEAMKNGVVPWRKPWSDSTLLPFNLKSNRPYRGVNVLLLGLTSFNDHRWLTMKQANELGGKVKQGEKSTMVVFWRFPEKKEEPEDAEKEKQRLVPILRYFNVFNVEQIEGLSVPPVLDRGLVSDEDRIKRAEVLATSMSNPPFVEERGSEAWYHPERDVVRIPKIGWYETIDSYYATLFHELAHATGHPKRLNRAGVTDKVHFGSEGYSKEELVAELTSAFCCATVALDNSLIDDSASYIHGWLSVLKADPKVLVYAAAQAQKATDYIKGIAY